VCHAIRDKKIKVGLAINPKTPIDDTIRQVLREGLVDMINAMTVEPGFGGQSLNYDVMPKIKALRQEFPWLDI